MVVLDLWISLCLGCTVVVDFWFSFLYGCCIGMMNWNGAFAWVVLLYEWIAFCQF
jgi:hypothetical protein